MIELIYLARLGLSLFLSGAIGFEREQQDKNAGLRTLMLVSLGSTIFTLIPFLLLPISKEMDFTYDFSRIIAYTIAGCGFLAGTVIISNKRKIKGITTSACLWAVVGVGILCGIGELALAIIATLFIYFTLKLKYFRIKIERIYEKKRKRKGVRYDKKS